MTQSISSALQAAVAHHQAGRLPQAGAIYQQILQVAPNHPDALHLLGVVAHQAGKNDVAVELISKAISLNPSAQMHYNLGNALQAQGKREAAVENYRKALSIQPDFVEAHVNLGNALQAQGKLDAAIDHYKKTLAFRPDFVEAYINLGNALQAQGKLSEAVASYHKALSFKPDDAGTHYNLGTALQAQGKLSEAVASYHKALSLKPDDAETHYNLGTALQAQGKLDAAAEAYRRTISLQPNNVRALGNLGVTLQAQGKLNDALECFHTALSIQPNDAVAHSNLGNALQEQGKLDEAVESFNRALAVRPDFAEAHLSRGTALAAQGKLDEAVSSYEKTLFFKPDFVVAHSTLLYLHAFTRDISPELECKLAANWEKIALNEKERSAAHDRLFDGSFEHRPRAGRKLKIGVVSAEIGQHAVAEFLEPFLEQLDRSRFHITLFPTAARSGPRATRLIELSDEFQSLVGISDGNAADRIRSSRIDVLIDTTGHMRDCRLGIFAHRAAPVQCHYIGYHGTTGLTEMDWFIADEALLPSACDSHFREGIWRLPRLWISYRGDTSLPNSQWKPSLDGTIWLGTFNNLSKVRENTLSLWAKVMNAIPESKLLLKDRKAVDSSVQERIRTTLFRLGISNERVKFATWVPDWHSHMALYDRLDIALDTIPLNSGTTAFDALWMGVPLVALEGDWMGGRMTTAMLRALGKPEWAAQNEDEYVSIVAGLARDVEGRKALRANQRFLMATSPLCDAKDLARSLENAFEAMFDQWLERPDERLSVTS